MAPSTLLMLAMLAGSLESADRWAVIPAHGAKPVGPYTPGIAAGEFLYVSGQGARDADGRLPESAEEQARQTLDNVKAIVEAAGLTMEHVVYVQVYLANMVNVAVFDRAWQRYFPRNPPARATLGIARMPTDTPMEATAVAVLDLRKRKAISADAVIAADRVYLSAKPAQDAETAMANLGEMLKSAGLDYGHLVFTNVYLDGKLTIGAMNQVYRKYFEAGNAPARATIQVAALPDGAHIEITGVAVRELAQRRAVRPLNMAPSPTASPCVWAGETLFCSAKSAFIPGPNSGIWADTVDVQVRQTMRNLLDGLEEAALDFSHVVATNVYVDQMDEFPLMNRTYAQYFSAVPPTRTTLQPLAPVDRKRDAAGRYPMLEQISLIAVR